MAGGFHPDSARRIADVVRKAEKAPHRPQRHAGPRVILPTRNALTTSIITARSGTTKGHGTATIYVDDGSGTGAMSVLMTGATIWSAFGTAVPSGKWIVVGIVDGLAQVLNGDC